MPLRPTNEARWRLARRAYVAFLMTFFLWVALYAGPNYFLFGKLTTQSPADFREVVIQKGLPALLAVREYEARRGRLPNEHDDLLDRHSMVWIRGSKLKIWSKWHHSVTYDLTSRNSRWMVRGAFTNGPIPGIPPEPPSTQRSQP